MAHRLAMIFLHRGWMNALHLLCAAVIASIVAVLLATAFVEHLRDDIRYEVARPFATLQRFDSEWDQVTDKIAERGGLTCSAEDMAWAKSQIFGMTYVQDVLIHDGRDISCGAYAGPMAKPVALGQGERLLRRGKVRNMWGTFDLTPLGVSGKSGYLSGVDNFVLLMPRLTDLLTDKSTISIDMVVHHDNGEPLWSYAAVQRLPHEDADAFWSLYGRLDSIVLTEKSCLRSGRTCMVGTLPLGDALASHRFLVLLGLAVSLTVGALGGIAVSHALRRHWSFERRFARNLDMSSLKCVYQPIIDPVTGGINGCEVLARWTDIDGSTVYPDTFIPVVAKLGLTRTFTDLLIRKALRELTEIVPDGVPFKLSCNLFPRDIDAAYLKPLVCNPDINPKGLRMFVEIVETEDLNVAEARQELSALRDMGVGIFMDDFGVGYSNLDHIVSLPLDGIKIDRCFAMAPPGSLRNAMLPIIIDMARRSGRRVVVEGIETEERFSQMAALGVNAVQGYFISRPVDAAGLAVFIAGWNERASRLRWAA